MSIIFCVLILDFEETGKISELQIYLMHISEKNIYVTHVLVYITNTYNMRFRHK